MWASAILAFIKAIPAIKEIFIQVVDLYNQTLEIADVNTDIKIQKEREAIIAAMKQPGLSDENRAILRRRLWGLGKL